MSDLLASATRLAQDRLMRGAADVDRCGVRRADLDALGEAGLLGAALAPAATFRAVQEVLAGADASTWFVQAQHHYPVRLLAGATSPELVRVCGDLVAGRDQEIRDCLSAAVGGGGTRIADGQDEAAD